MCGLVGAFRADGAKLEKLDRFMWQGLYMSALRGMGGTGVGIVHSDYEMDFAKSHVSSPNFLCSEEWDWIDKNLLTCRAALGHTRSATNGTVATKNSHPFAFEAGDTGVMMIHNGVVSNWSSLTPVGFNHAVDSAHVAHSLFHKGGLETLKELVGAYTLIWYDKKTRTINLARNEERELFYCTNKENTCFWFASELDMLASILRRNGIPHVGGKEFLELPKFTLCSYDLTKKELEPKLTNYEEKKYLPAPQSERGGLYGTNDDDWRSYTKMDAGVGDRIFINIRDDDDLALVLYKAIGDGEDQTSEANAHGYVYGTRSVNFGSVVKLVGISYRDWHERLKYIKYCLPCKILRMEKDKTTAQGSVYTLFECTVDYDGVAREIRRMNPSLEMVKRRRQELAEEKAKKAGADTAGRALPDLKVLDNSVPERPNVGPDDGSDIGGRSRLGLVSRLMSGPKGIKISLEAWQKMAVEGCYFCDGAILDSDEGKVDFWEHPCNPEDRKTNDPEYSIICPLCVTDPKKIEALVG